MTNVRIGSGGSSNHEIIINKEVQSLSSRGYKCERQYEILLGTESGQHQKRVIVDIRATRQSEELLIEVGTLSTLHCEDFLGYRIFLLKHLRPNAKIIWITQWKNFINTFDWREEKERYEFNCYLFKKYGKTKDYVQKMDD